MSTKTALDYLSKKQLKKLVRCKMRTINGLKNELGNIEQSTQVFRDRYVFILHGNAMLRTENEELKEALSRRRQLYKSMEELVNRGQPKSIEDMADALLTVLANEERSTRAQWNDMNEEEKDIVITKLMKIIS